MNGLSIKNFQSNGVGIVTQWGKRCRVFKTYRMDTSKSEPLHVNCSVGDSGVSIQCPAATNAFLLGRYRSWKRQWLHRYCLDRVSYFCFPEKKSTTSVWCFHVFPLILIFFLLKFLSFYYQRCHYKY